MLEKKKLRQLIKRYEEVYLFAQKRISTMLTEQCLEDMTLEQSMVLRYLFFNGKCMSSQLADYCRVNKSAITSKIDRLVAKGYVERIRDEDDRRIVFLKITEKGRDIYENVEDKIEEFIGPYLQELAEEEVEAFLNIYEKITNIIEKKHGGNNQ